MAFSSWSEFWAMGGYALYVWLAYGVSALVIAGLILNGWVAKQNLKRQVKQQQARQQRIQAAQEGSQKL